MGWAHCESDTGRPIGYGVVATCDYPGCRAVIDRGLAYVCGQTDGIEMHDPEDWGCGGYFCEKHRPCERHHCPLPEPEEEEEPTPC